MNTATRLAPQGTLDYQVLAAEAISERIAEDASLASITQNYDLNFTHVRTSNGKGGLTIAFVKPFRRSDKMVEISIGVCSKKDTFTKRKGRLQAALNFKSGSRMLVPTTKTMGIGTQMQLFFTTMVYKTLEA